MEKEKKQEVVESLRRSGRNGDTILAHINEQEAALLKMMGGAGTINPKTGLPEFYTDWYSLPSFFDTPSPSYFADYSVPSFSAPTYTAPEIFPAFVEPVYTPPVFETPTPIYEQPQIKELANIDPFLHYDPDAPVVSRRGGFLRGLFETFGPIAPVVLNLVAPGVGGAIGSILTQTATTTLASQVVGAAVIQGALAEAQGGDFVDGAIRGAVTAGVAPVVANTVGTTVANLMEDSSFKSLVSNTIASSASSAVSAALTGGDVEQAALTGALAGAGGSIGREIGTAADLGTTPFSEQTQMLAAQEQGLGGAGSLGANLGQAAGAVAAGADPTQAIINAIIQTQQEQRAATPDTADQVSPKTPVSPPPGAEITTAPPPETGQISDVGLMDGIAGTIPEIDTPSTQEITIPDQITQELGGVQEGIAGTIPPLDQELINLITQAQPELAPVQEVVAPPVEDIISGVQEGIAETIPEDLGVQTGIVETIPEDFGVQQGVAEGIPTETEIAELANPALDVLGQPLTPEAVDIEPIPQDPLLGLSAPSVGEGEQEAIDYQALEGLSSADVGLGEEQAIDQANLDALADLSSAEVGEGEQEAINRQALEDLSSAEVGLGEQQAIEDSFPRIDTTPYIRDTYLSLGRKRPDFGPTVTTLGQALQAPFFPSSPVSGLTSYRGAGEIEGQRTGKPRRNVWNESSLRLTDALGL